MYSHLTVAPTMAVIVAMAILMLSQTPTSWSCSTKQTDRPSEGKDVRTILILTWVEEPVNWTTAAAKCRSVNPTYNMKLATLNSERADSILENFRRTNFTGSSEYPTGFWKARKPRDKEILCPAISISSSEWGSGSTVNWNSVQDCGNLFGGIMCEGSYIGLSGIPVTCFGIGPCSAIFGG